MYTCSLRYCRVDLFNIVAYRLRSNNLALFIVELFVFRLSCHVEVGDVFQVLEIFENPLCYSEKAEGSGSSTYEAGSKQQLYFRI